MRLFEELPTIITLAILAVVAYAVYKVVTAIRDCESFFQYITTGSCSKAGATGTPGSGFPGFPGSTSPGQSPNITGDPYKCGFLDWVKGACNNFEGGSCGVSDYWAGNCSAPSSTSSGPASTPTSADASGYRLTDDVFAS